MPPSSSMLAPVSRSLTSQTITKQAVAATTARKVALPSPLPSLRQASSSLSTLATRPSPVAISPSSSHRTFQTTAQSLQPSSSGFSGLTDAEYHEVASEFFDTLTDQLELLFEENEVQDDWEYDFSDGVLNLHLPPHGTYVLNKQPPNKQIWLSSPSSGPKRFDYHDSRRWKCVREGKSTYLDTLLSRELGKIFGLKLELCKPV